MSDDLRSVALVLGVVAVVLLLWNMFTRSPCEKRCAQAYQRCALDCDSDCSENMADGAGNEPPVGVVGKADEDHSQRIKEMSLEPSVEESHRRFVKETHRKSGSSTSTISTSDTFPNTFVGLRRPEKLLRATFAGQGSRIVHSEYPEEMGEYSPFQLQ